MTLRRKLDGGPPRTSMPNGAIDTQCHLYLPDYPAVPGAVSVPEGCPGPNDYRVVMRRLGVDRTVVTQGNAHGFDNASLLACLREMGPVARGVAVVTGETSDAEMQRLSDGGIVGARIMDLPGGAVGLDQLEAVDARAEAFAWMLAIQFEGSKILEHETRLAGLRSRWVLDHHGKFFAGVTPESAQVDAVKRLIDGGRCWFKFAACYESSLSGGPAYSDVGAVARTIASYAPDRIIWGTNWPHNMIRRSEDYPDDAELLDLAMGWIPDDRGRQLALVDNPRELFFRS